MKKLRKILFVLVCIVALLVPYSVPVFAALRHTDSTANLETLRMHQGGEESSGTLTGDYALVYDEAPHAYRVGITNVLKLIVSGDANYENELYCLNGEKSFPGTTSLVYNNVANLKDELNLNVRSLGLSAGNYKSLIWLVNNMYLKKQAPEQKDEFLSKAFATQIGSGDGTTVDLIKAFLTDDDIEVVQQWAMWYFTNGDASNPAAYNPKYENFAQINITTIEDPNNYRSYHEVFGTAVRQDYANILYTYLITEAMAADELEVTYPTINKSNTPVTDVYGDYYKVGPFKINSGTAPTESYNLFLTDGNNIISRSKYEILIEGESSFTSKGIKEIFDKNYYIYIPMEDNDINKLKITLSYSSYETRASMWVTSESMYQPVTLITREQTLNEDQIEIDIERKTADLSLRKYITKINNTSINSRIPTVDISGLIDETSTTAEYKHPKNPLEVEIGDTIIYEIRVYNEGDIEAKALSIVDYIPQGLQFVEDSHINEIYGWAISSDGRVAVTEYLKDSPLDPFNKQMDELDSAYVQIELKVKSGLNSGLVLTNVAEIAEDNINDRDSVPESINPNNINTENWRGNSNNKTDLGDTDYHYRGVQDDDDFEKVIVKGQVFDLSLKKFINKINGEAPQINRAPVVDVTNLKNNSSTNATYTHPKTPLTVTTGDIVIYTIRVYNEGDIDGYAEEVVDYLPKGLGFLPNHKINIDNYWAIPSNTISVKLSTIPNAKDNLKLDDFEDILNLDDVDVVIADKYVSTKLGSSNVNNLIKAFDKQNGTTLSYKDIQIACIVMDTSKIETANDLRNIAEIQKHTDENGNDITDIDSTPGDVDPDNYPGNNSNQDDHDYERLTTTEVEEFELAVRKFITEINNQSITNRVPTITKNSDGTLRYSHTKEPYSVANNDIVTYTIRVYNEGNIDGYCSEVTDDLPKGLEYLPEHETNKKYEWKMYDSSGNVTTDVKKATSIKTKYLSKEESDRRGDNCLIKAFDPNTAISANNPDYKDVKVTFKVVETDIAKNGNRIITNVATIPEDSNKDKNKTKDEEHVYVKYFDLALKKEIVKAIITEDGVTREINAANNKLMKVEINRRKTGSTTVKFVFNITVINEGEIPGYAKEIKDRIPKGLEFIQTDNPDWRKISDDVVVTNALENTLLKPGESASVMIVLKWINGDDNFGVKTNIAEISEDYNENGAKDIDSTPDNYQPNRPYEDDEDEASVLVSISTGTAITYIVLSSTVLAIIGTGVFLIKKYVL